MLLKLSLLSAVIITIAIVSYSYFGNGMGNVYDVIEITDKDFADEDVNENGEILISDSEIENVQNRTMELKTRTSQTYNLKNENATLTVSYDDFGNKTERKVFNNHPRIQMIMVRTPLKGDKQVYVYAQSGKVENVPTRMLNTVLNTPPDTIANIVGIYETRADLERRKTETAESKQIITQQNRSYNFDESVKPIPEPVFPNQYPNTPNNVEDQPSQPDNKREQISEDQKPPVQE